MKRDIPIYKKHNLRLHERETSHRLSSCIVLFKRIYPRPLVDSIEPNSGQEVQDQIKEEEVAAFQLSKREKD